jgi:hypothetical protein
MNKVKLKSKINTKGDLYVCIKDTIYEENDQTISFDTNDNIFKKDKIKAGRYIPISNIGTSLEKPNIVSSKYKDQITQDIEGVKKLLEDYRIEVVDEENRIKFKNSPSIIPHKSRTSCSDFKL